MRTLFSCKDVALKTEDMYMYLNKIFSLVLTRSFSQNFKQTKKKNKKSFIKRIITMNEFISIIFKGEKKINNLLSLMVTVLKHVMLKWF